MPMLMQRSATPSGEHRVRSPWVSWAVMLCAGLMLLATAPAHARMWVWSDDADSAFVYPPQQAPSGALTTGKAGRFSIRQSGGIRSASMAGDPTVNLFVSTEADFDAPVGVSDGAGGMILVLEDIRNVATDGDIYAQHLLHCGIMDPSWPAGGVPITQATGDDALPEVTSDGSGGAFVAWSNDLTSIYAQHLLSTGAVDPTWPTNGLPLATSGTNRFPHITSDGSHGAYVSWDHRTSGSRVFVQHLLSTGADPGPGWPAGGVPVTSVTNVGNSALGVICSDGAGGAIVAWDFNNPGSTAGVDIYAQRLSPSGALLWGPGGTPACGAPANQLLWGIATGFIVFPNSSSADGQSNPIVPDGSGGCFITWTDSRNFASNAGDVFSQHLTSTGAIATGWLPDGLPMCTDPADQSLPTILSDGAGGAIVTWIDARPGVFAQHVTGAGVVDGPLDGLQVSTGPTAPGDYLVGVSDGATGGILLWTDLRNEASSGADIYAQHLKTSPFGVDPAWPANGAPISTASGDQGVEFGEVPDGAGGLIAAWPDGRNGDDEIYAQAVTASGTLRSSPSTVTATAGSGGSISPSGAVSVCEADPTFSITASGGYHILDVKVDGVSVGAVASYAFVNVTSDHTIDASFAPNTFTAAGRVSAGCPSPGTGVLGVTVDAFAVGSGDLIAQGVTNATGNYTIPGLPAGDYTIAVVLPLDYRSAAPRQPVTGTSGTVTADFALNCVTLRDHAREVSFWMDQVGLRSGGGREGCGGDDDRDSDDGHGNVKVSSTKVCSYLDLIAAHFNNNLINQVVVYQPPASGDCLAKLLVAKQLLNLARRAPEINEARQQLMALLLNVAAAYISQTQVISADGATVSQAITYCDSVIDSPTGNYERAANICEKINDEDLLPSGWVSLSTPLIEYRLTPNTRAVFRLDGVRPNPTHGRAEVSFSLLDRGPAVLEVLDLAGRSVRRQDVSNLGPGPHTLRLEGGHALRAGVYMVRLSQDGRRATTRFVVAGQ